MRCVFATCDFWPGVVTDLNMMKAVINESYNDVQTESWWIKPTGLSFNLIRQLKTNPPNLLVVGGWDQNIRMLVQNVNRMKTKVLL